MKINVYTEEKLQEVFGQMRKLWRASKFLRISYTDEKPRSLPQNAISHKWYEQIARELAEDTPEGVKNECKLRFGVPILRAEDEGFRELYDEAIKSLPYEHKLKIMRLLPVTSIMTADQLSRYLVDMQKSYAGRVLLEFPEEDN